MTHQDNELRQLAAHLLNTTEQTAPPNPDATPPEPDPAREFVRNLFNPTQTEDHS